MGFFRLPLRLLLAELVDSSLKRLGRDDLAVVLLLLLLLLLRRLLELFDG